MEKSVNKNKMQDVVVPLVVELLIMLFLQKNIRIFKDILQKLT